MNTRNSLYICRREETRGLIGLTNICNVLAQAGTIRGVTVAAIRKDGGHFAYTVVAPAVSGWTDVSCLDTHLFS